MKKTLYPYQKEGISEIINFFKSGSKRVVFQLPTGGGKTITSSSLINLFYRQNPSKDICFFVHRKELLDQFKRTYERQFEDAEVGIIDAKSRMKRFDLNIHVCMIDSAYNRLKRDPNWFGNNVGLLVIDECHNAGFDKIFKFFPNTLTVGLTATPTRLSKKNLMRLVYDDIVSTTNIQELIDFGSLSPNKTFCVDNKVNYKKLKKSAGDYSKGSIFEEYSKAKHITNVVKAYEQICLGRKTMIFNASIEHSKLVDAAFNSAGYKSMHLDGTTKERNMILKWFEKTPGAILQNVAILTCLSSDTEVLTKTGWKGIKEISKSDYVAQWDKGDITFENPQHIHSHFHNGKMLRLDGRYVSLNVTSDHDMLVKINGEFIKTKARNISEVKSIIPVSGFCKPDEIKAKQKSLPDKKRFISYTSYNYRKKGMSHADSINEAEVQWRLKTQLRYKNPNELSLKECELIGFWLGDGSKFMMQNGGFRYSLCQGEGSPKIIKWIHDTLKELNIEYSFYKYKGGIKHVNGRICDVKGHVNFNLCIGTGGHKQNRSGIYRLLPYLEKDGSELYWGLNRDQFFHIMKGLFKADGWHGNNKEYTGQKIIGDNKNLFNLLQSIGVCRGYRVTIKKIKKRKFNKKQLYGISLRDKTEHQLTNDLPRLYDCKNELVWCLTMTKGTLVTRNNGTVTIMGNTGYDEPSIESVIMNRPTLSLPLWKQCTGRGSRIYPGKPYFTIIDLGDNVYRHGDWSFDVDWKDMFYNSKLKEDTDGVAPIKTCPECFFIMPVQTMTCPECEYQFGTDEIEENTEELKLKLVTDNFVKKVNVHKINNFVEKRKWNEYTAVHLIKEALIRQIRSANIKVRSNEFNALYAEYMKKVHEWGKENEKSISFLDQFAPKILKDELKRLNLI